MAQSVTNSYVNENSTSVANNTSNVTVYAIFTKTSGEYASDNPQWKIYVNGSVVASGTKNFTAGTKGNIDLGSWTGDIAHNADGTGSMTWCVSFEGNKHPTAESNWFTTGTLTKSLTKINRGLMRVKDGSTWKTGLVYVKDGSTWKLGQAYVKDGNNWKLGI